MSGTMTQAGTGSAPEGTRGQRGRGRSITPVHVVIIAATLVALGLRLYYQYTRPGFLLGVTEYDDGPYFGSAVLLVHGVLPYRDFVLVQPPGITLLMSPTALLSYVTGTGWALAVARVLTVLASTAVVFLAGWLVRHRGLLAVLVSCGITAVYPNDIAAAHTVLVESWLALFCLLGAVAVFDGDRLTDSRKRLVWAGISFGFAGAIETWAIVPVLVLAALFLPRLRQGVTFVLGVAAGFLVPVVPFAALGPSQFYRSLITAQIGSRAHALRVGLHVRLVNMFGLPATGAWSSSVVLAVVALTALVVLAGFLVGPALARGWPAKLHWFAGCTTVLVMLLFMWPPQFHYHFSAFLGPFLAITVGLSLASLVDAAIHHPAPGSRRRGTANARLADGAIAGVAAVVLVLMAVVQGRAERRVPPVIGPIPASVDRIIPSGACVLTDQVTITLLANRFVSDVPGCAHLIDGLGTDLAYSNGLNPATGAGRVPAVATLWSNAFDHAQYVILSWANDRRVPWTPALHSYLADHFTQVLRYQGRITVYARKGLPGS